MVDKTSTDQTSYQGRGSNLGRWFGIGHGNTYGRGWGRRFNPTKPKFRGKREALRSDVYSIGDARQEEKYTNNTEAVLNYIQGYFNKYIDIKEALGDLNHSNFNIIRPKTPDSIAMKSSVE